MLPGVLLGLAALSALPALDAESKRRLEQGEVLIESLEPTGGKGLAARGVAIVDGAPDLVFPVVDHCKYFQEFMPRNKRSADLERTKERSICFVEIELPWPFDALWAETIVFREPLPEGGYRRTWRIKRGTYRRNSGSWLALPWGPEGKRTLLVYEVDADPDLPVPDAMIRAAEPDELREVFVAVRKRVAAIQRGTVPRHE